MLIKNKQLQREQRSLSTHEFIEGTVRLKPTQHETGLEIFKYDTVKTNG